MRHHKYFKDKDIADLVSSLSSIESLRKTYLSCNDEDVVRLISMLPMEETFVSGDVTSGPHPSSLRDENVELETNPFGLSKKIKVKLVITEMPNHKFLRYFLSPVISNVPSLHKDFGM